MARCQPLAPFQRDRYAPTLPLQAPMSPSAHPQLSAYRVSCSIGFNAWPHLKTPNSRPVAALPANVTHNRLISNIFCIQPGSQKNTQSAKHSPHSGHHVRHRACRTRHVWRFEWHIPCHTHAPRPLSHKKPPRALSINPPASSHKMAQIERHIQTSGSIHWPNPPQNHFVLRQFPDTSRQ